MICDDKATKGTHKNGHRAGIRNIERMKYY